MSDLDARAEAAGGAGDAHAPPPRIFGPSRAGWWERLAPLRLSLATAFEREMEAGRGFLWLPVLLGVGILLYFALPSEPSLVALLLATGALSLLAWRLRRRVGAFRIVVACTAVLAGVTVTSVQTLGVQS